MIAADSLAKIADYLDCSVDYLLGRTDDPQCCDNSADIAKDVSPFHSLRLLPAACIRGVAVKE